MRWPFNESALKRLHWEVGRGFGSTREQAASFFTLNNRELLPDKYCVSSSSGTLRQGPLHLGRKTHLLFATEAASRTLPYLECLILQRGRL